MLKMDCVTSCVGKPKDNYQPHSVDPHCFTELLYCLSAPCFDFLDCNSTVLIHTSSSHIVVFGFSMHAFRKQTVHNLPCNKQQTELVTSR